MVSMAGASDHTVRCVECENLEKIPQFHSGTIEVHRCPYQGMVVATTWRICPDFKPIKGKVA